MVGMYHGLFFKDVRFALVVVVTMFGVGFWGVEEMFLLIPFVCIWAASQTAFDASYLIMARHYARALEAYLNNSSADGVLVAAELERAYLFPLDAPKVVTIPIRGGFSWFSFMTLLITTNGVISALAAIAFGQDVLTSWGSAATVVYYSLVGLLAAAAMGVGVWWFVMGEGERRLSAVLAERFLS